MLPEMLKPGRDVVCTPFTQTKTEVFRKAKFVLGEFSRSLGGWSFGTYPLSNRYGERSCSRDTETPEVPIQSCF